MTDAMQIGSGTSELEQAFLAALHEKVAPCVLELGTLRSEADFPTHHAHWAPHAMKYTKTDMAPGTDVDVVADAHHLLEVFSSGSYDAVIAVSVFEHLKQPWVVADQLRNVLRSKGLCYIVTHQTFPIHGYPSDFFRYTREGLASVMEWAGFKTIGTDYHYPCTITPPAEVIRWNVLAPSFLNVEWYGHVG